MCFSGEVVAIGSAIAQPKGHTPFWIFRYLSVDSLDSGAD